MNNLIVGSEALARGEVTRHELARWYRRLFPDVYLPKRQRATLRDRTVGAWLWSRRRATVAGVAASALHGAQWVDDDIPIELIWDNTHPPRGIKVRNETTAEDEFTYTCRLPVTTPARTAFDLGRHLPRGNSLARLDALMRATPFSAADVRKLAKRYPGARGLRQLRELLPLVDGGAASPKESWLRLVLVDAGFPPPVTQIPVHKDWRLVAMLDTGWEDFKVAVEYDGDQHRTDRREYVRGHRREQTLAQLGWLNIKVIAEDRRDNVIDRTYRALTSRGWTGELAPRRRCERIRLSRD
ncbi:hypothetical protein [Mycolicibacter heraklionensis]|uniref:hypothetical protein n=1 Tax=Mycolicibacter heraklionensis TaxID=512402 RepID=UPI0007EBC899|nr:hypothetical protein [Mycolicibacter heraklionensis]OBG35594.1 hypothetical protein A5671_22380 [Mycolicibacter heraklionensis]